MFMSFIWYGKTIIRTKLFSIGLEVTTVLASLHLHRENVHYCGRNFFGGQVTFLFCAFASCFSLVGRFLNLQASWTILRSWDTFILENTAPRAAQTGSTVANMIPLMIWKMESNWKVNYFTLNFKLFQESFLPVWRWQLQGQRSSASAPRPRCTGLWWQRTTGPKQLQRGWPAERRTACRTTILCGWTRCRLPSRFRQSPTKPESRFLPNINIWKFLSLDNPDC